MFKVDAFWYASSPDRSGQAIRTLNNQLMPIFSNEISVIKALWKLGNHETGGALRERLKRGCM